MILFIDNYDSFTYNLVQLVGVCNPDVQVVRNDAITLDDIDQMNPSHILLSPGPGYPKDAGMCEAVIKRFGKSIPMLGICLGHQAICACFGATIAKAKTLMHGKASEIHIAGGSPIFHRLPPVITGARYHSLIAKRDTLPDELLVIAEDAQGEVMAVKHKDCDLYGLQFHPESILTPDGHRILENFLQLGGEKR